VTADVRWPATCCGWLVRHGVTDGNRAGLVQGQTGGTALSAEGRRQARAAAAGLLSAGVHPAGVLSSDLERCRQTAGVLADALGLPVHLDPALRERSFGVLEGRRWNDVPGEAVGIVDGRVVDPGAAPPGGESVSDLAARVEDALRRAAARPGPVVLVTHGGPIRVLTHGGDPGQWIGLSWGEVPHAFPMPVCLRTANPATCPGARADRGSTGVFAPSWSGPHLPANLRHTVQEPRRACP
jgi:broad specificity phosphatase PhoE